MATKQKEKYSNAIEKQFLRASAVGMNAPGYLGINRDISVKHLCRSFGDLTSLNSEDNNSNHFQQVYRTKSVCDLRKLEQLPIYTGVSVRNLRDSYCNLIGLTTTTDSNNTQHHHNQQNQHEQPHSLMLPKRSNNIINSPHKIKAIKLNIKQFDMKSSFSKFDALQKKNMQNLQNGKGEANGQSSDQEKKCHACGKVVFQMEQVKAEKKFWHKNCFRCSVCDKNLNVDTYQSHEGVLYCKPHFKSLFAPKAVEESDEPVKPRKLEMIIRESQPIELPPDVVRSSDKSDLGLEELQQLNVRQRFQVFENYQEAKVELDKNSAANVKRSTSILSKLARFQAKGMNVGADDSLNGVSYENSSSEEEEEENDDDENQEDIELIRAKRAQKEKPMSFKEMHDIKSKFESGQLMSKEGRREERKQELQNIRSRLFMGKQAKIKEMYQQAVADSEQTITASSRMTADIDISDKAKLMKEKFEKGDAFDGESKRTMNDEDLSVFEQGIGKQSRSLFLELDATASKSPIQQSPSSATLNRMTPRQTSQTVVSSDDIVRSDSKVDDVQIETADIVSKFKFFETYKPSEKEKKQFRITPPRDGVTKLPSPESNDNHDTNTRTEQDEILELAQKSNTASKMLSKFRQLEGQKEERPMGPKPLKRFTPPPDSERRITPNEDSGPEYSDSEDEDDEECEEEEDEEQDDDPNYVKSSYKNDDEFLKAAQSAERAKQLREKFEKWEKNEIKKEMNNSSVNLFEPTADDGQMETAKSLRARFEQMQQEEPKLPNTRIKVNRFVIKDKADGCWGEEDQLTLE
ncbi:CLUMA_CG012184, isoform A [Clunio marinus]|uniref:CLUMA_CG012184, isoform A n=1 Tax=Clunio marinus TaxID=568069 RepID=A0A1J1IJL1_9DIPT|nr:CLUMA_CG012184, isoform A [Clunio marinus]